MDRSIIVEGNGSPTSDALTKENKKAAHELIDKAGSFLLIVKYKEPEQGGHTLSSILNPLDVMNFTLEFSKWMEKVTDGVRRVYGTE